MIGSEQGHTLSFINRFRPMPPSRKTNPGGGVSIVFNKNRVSFSEYNIRRKKYELVCAKGRITNNTRPLFVLGIYIPPKMKAGAFAECMELVPEAILKIKAETKNPYIVLGGDFNRRNMETALDDYHDIAVLPTPLSRADTCLDVAAATFAEEVGEIEALPPLQTRPPLHGLSLQIETYSQVQMGAVLCPHH